MSYCHGRRSDPLPEAHCGPFKIRLELLLVRYFDFCDRISLWLLLRVQALGCRPSLEPGRLGQRTRARAACGERGPVGGQLRRTKRDVRDRTESEC
jgi:hypothetical protein